MITEKRLIHLINTKKDKLDSSCKYELSCANKLDQFVDILKNNTKDVSTDETIALENVDDYDLNLAIAKVKKDLVSYDNTHNKIEVFKVDIKENQLSDQLFFKTEIEAQQFYITKITSLSIDSLDNFHFKLSNQFISKEHYNNLFPSINIEE